MARKHLFRPVDDNSTLDPKHKEHGTHIRLVLGKEGMRVIGRAYDKNIIKKEQGT